MASTEGLRSERKTLLRADGLGDEALAHLDAHCRLGEPPCGRPGCEPAIGIHIDTHELPCASGDHWINQCLRLGMVARDDGADNRATSEMAQGRKGDHPPFFPPNSNPPRPRAAARVESA